MQFSILVLVDFYAELCNVSGLNVRFHSVHVRLPSTRWSHQWSDMCLRSPYLLRAVGLTLQLRRSVSCTLLFLGINCIRTFYFHPTSLSQSRPLLPVQAAYSRAQEGQLLQHTLRHGWAFTPLRRFWTCGYHVGCCCSCRSSLSLSISLSLSLFLSLALSHIWEKILPPPPNEGERARESE